MNKHTLRNVVTGVVLGAGLAGVAYGFTGLRNEPSAEIVSANKELAQLQSTEYAKAESITRHCSSPGQFAKVYCERLKHDMAQHTSRIKSLENVFIEYERQQAPYEIALLGGTMLLFYGAARKLKGEFQ